MKKLFNFFLILFFSYLFSACDEDEISINNLNSYLKLYSQDYENVLKSVNNSEFLDISKNAKYGLSLYTITYKTTYLGEEIIASGLVSFPDTDEPVPMLSFNHGTESRHLDAPSDNLVTYSFFSNAASLGYIFVMSDYLGFGSSKNILHPYYRSDIVGNTIVDMLKAVKELAEIENYNFNGDVFLAGYSEGGFATMAAHKNIEENKPKGINLIASAPAAGGYDVVGMLDYFLSLKTYPHPYYLAYVALSYKTTYQWDLELSDIFKEPFASIIPNYFNGSYSGGQINDVLTYNIDSLLTEEFKNNVHSSSKYSEVINAFEENSLDNWVPKTKMYLYHGTDDIAVPYNNSVNTYDNFIKLGTSSSIISLNPLQGKDHASGSLPYMIDIFDKFEALK